jgi:sugar phosphate isomerase/epimerase
LRSAAASAPGLRDTDRVNHDQIAVQLYTVRDELTKDPARTLSTLASTGYRHVELAGTAGLPAARFRELLDTHGLHVIGAHVGLDKLGDGLTTTLDELEILGCSLAIVPWVGPEVTRDFAGGAELGRRLAGIAHQARDRGIRIGYHNHTFEFEGAPGERLWDGLVATAPPDIRFEVDVCWVFVGGQDPVDVIESLAGRVGSLHLKDVQADRRTPIIPGHGILRWREILGAGDSAGVEWFVVEEDEPAVPLQAATNGYRYIRGLAAPSGLS